MRFLLVALVCATAVYGKTLTPKMNYKELFFPVGYIVGGTDAKPGEFPHQVSYQNFNEKVGKHTHNCGGSIINEEYILTAAHCVDSSILPPNQPRIVAGMTKQDSDETNSKQTINVAKIISHPAWNKDKLQNDIAILKLETKLTFDEYVKPTKLPTAGYTPSETLTVSGWGLLKQDDPAGVPNNLQKVQVPLYEKQMCQMIFQILGLEIVDCHFCAGGEGEEKGVCNGDSGGPLISSDGTQVGVVSFGLGCGSPMFPAVYANVIHFASWIQETITSN